MLGGHPAQPALRQQSARPPGLHRRDLRPGLGAGPAVGRRRRSRRPEPEPSLVVRPISSGPRRCPQSLRRCLRACGRATGQRPAELEDRPTNARQVPGRVGRWRLRRGGRRRRPGVGHHHRLPSAAANPPARPGQPPQRGRGRSSASTCLARICGAAVRAGAGGRPDTKGRHCSASQEADDHDDARRRPDSPRRDHRPGAPGAPG